jgi:hypothetical protein
MSLESGDTPKIALITGITGQVKSQVAFSEKQNSKFF